MLEQLCPPRGSARTNSRFDYDRAPGPAGTEQPAKRRGGAAQEAGLGDDESAEDEAAQEAVACTQIEQPRAVGNRRHLSGRLEQIARDIPAGPQRRAAVLALMKEALAAGRGEVRRRFEDEAASGTLTVRAEA